MKTMLTTSTLVKFLSLTSLLTVMACAGEDPNSGSTQNPINGAQGECADDEEGESEDGPNDKVLCEADADCDSDEFCLNGRCTGYDGDEEGEDEACEGDDEEDGEEEDADDKITCSVDTDCDPDEVCADGLCTGLDDEEEDGEEEDGEEEDGEEEDGEEEDGEEEDGEEEDADDRITCSVDTDCDADEVCTNGLCT